MNLKILTIFIILFFSIKNAKEINNLKDFNNYLQKKIDSLPKNCKIYTENDINEYITIYEKQLNYCFQQDYASIFPYFNNLTNLYFVSHNYELLKYITELSNKYKDLSSLQNCEYDRKSAIDCFEKYFDLNHDKIVQVDEIKNAIKNYSSFWLKVISFVFQPIPRIMKACDHDNNGEISREDYENSKATCMNTCNSLKDLHNYLCKKAQLKFG